MRNPLTSVFFAVLLLGTFGSTVCAQLKYVCSCRNVKGSTCSASVMCTRGCSAICGTGDNCHVSCRKDLIGPNFSIDFVRMSGKAISEQLSAKTKMRINFKPNLNTGSDVYDYHLQNGDIWRLLEFLDKVGTVTVDGMSFGKLRELKRQLLEDQPLESVQLHSMPAEELAERLNLMGLYVTVASGDPTKPISLEMKKKNLSAVLREIEKKTGVKMAASKTGGQD